MMALNVVRGCNGPFGPPGDSAFTVCLPRRFEAMKHRRRLVALGVLVIALLVAPVAGAQQQTGRIDGVLTDASGAVVPGATVQLTSERARQEAVTSANGDYHFLNLSPGTYTVTAKLPGFA